MQLPDIPKILIFGNAFISTPERRDLVLLWSRVMRRLNPDLDILLVNKESRYDPRTFVRDCNVIVNLPDTDAEPKHFVGWDNDFMFGVHYAMTKGYDWIAFIESDLIFAQPVLPIVQKLTRIGVLAASAFNFDCKFIETGLMFLSVKYLSAINFLGKYAQARRGLERFIEIDMESVLANELVTLPLRGLRNDFDAVTRQNFGAMFPGRADYLTHCKDAELYRILLEKNRIEL